MASGVDMPPGQRREQTFDGQKHRGGNIKEIKIQAGGEAFLFEKEIQHGQIDMDFDGLVELYVHQHDHKQQHGEYYCQNPVDFQISDKGKGKKNQDVDNGHETAEVSQPADDQIDNSEAGGRCGGVVEIAESDGHGKEDVQEQKPVSPAYGAGNFVLVGKKTGNFQIIHVA